MYVFKKILFIFKHSSILHSSLHLPFSFPLTGVFNDTINVIMNVITKLIVLAGHEKFLCFTLKL